MADDFVGVCDTPEVYHKLVVIGKGTPLGAGQIFRTKCGLWTQTVRRRHILFRRPCKRCWPNGEEG